MYFSNSFRDIMKHTRNTSHIIIITLLAAQVVSHTNEFFYLSLSTPLLLLFWFDGQSKSQ